MTNRGINYYYLRDFYNGNLPRPSLEKPRVFISHQKRILKQRELLQTICKRLALMCTLISMTKV